MQLLDQMICAEIALILHITQLDLCTSSGTRGVVYLDSILGQLMLKFIGDIYVHIHTLYVGVFL